jgi:hypothetical protein
MGDTKGWFNGTGVDIKRAGYVSGPGAILARGDLLGSFNDDVPAGRI